LKFLDSKSLYNFVLNDINNWTYQEKARTLEELGFACIVKFKEVSDALKLFSREVEVQLPLNS
jgi:hypothetical protein